MLTEKKAVISNGLMMIKNAQKEVDSVTSATELLQSMSAFFVEELLDISAKKRVKVRIILELPEHETSLMERIEEKRSSKGSFVELRYAFKPLSHYVIVDCTQVSMATSPEPSLGKLPYLWTNAPNFATVLQKHFEDLWQACVKSKPITAESSDSHLK